MARVLKVALYSHDTMGLGHMRRNLSIARALSASNLQANVLIVAGSNVATGFAMPEGVDSITLPSLYKKPDGKYRSRSLGLALPELIELRARTIRGALEAYQPDVLIVDNVPRGVGGELDDTLLALKQNTNALVVLGMRDVLDEPAVVYREWKRRANEECIRQYYDAIWVYGDQRLYDPAREYRFTDETAEKIRYTGYLNRALPVSNPEQLNNRLRVELDMPEGDLVLCLAGGGQDGGRLAQLFCDSLLPDNHCSLILTGPYMPSKVKKELHARARQNPRLRVMDFHPEPTELISCADRIVSMGGYNTISEILSLGKHALIVPRIHPRQEQMIRATRLKELGLVDLAHPEMVNRGVIADWLSTAHATFRHAGNIIDFKGLSRVPQLLHDMLTETGRHSARGANL
jgi:predicted glycosyltransferase